MSAIPNSPFEGALITLEMPIQGGSQTLYAVLSQKGDMLQAQIWHVSANGGFGGVFVKPPCTLPYEPRYLVLRDLLDSREEELRNFSNDPYFREGLYHLRAQIEVALR